MKYNLFIMNTKLKIGTIILLVSVFVIGGLIILNKRKPQVQRFSTISFPNLEIQWFRVSPDGKWLLIAALDGSNAVSFTYRIEGGQEAKLQAVPSAPPNHFTISNDGKALTLYQVDGALAYFERKSEGDKMWGLSSKLAPEPYFMKKIWNNFSLLSSHGLGIEKEAKPYWFPSLQGFDPNQEITYTEQPIEQGHIAFISASPFNRWLWVVDKDGQNLQRLVSVQNVEVRTGHKPFAWSVDGKRLFYEVSATDTGDEAIWVFEVSKETKSLLVDSAYYPVVSSDGKWLAYRKPPYRETIEIMDLETKEIIGRTSGRYSINWSPDGLYLVILDSKDKYPALIQFFRSFPFVLEIPKQNYFIKIVSRDGKTTTVLPMPIYEERLPDWSYVDRWGGQDIQWSKDGKRVFFPYELDKIGFAIISDE